MHIGLIGGIGPAATEFYYRRMAKAHDEAGARMELTIVHAQVQELLQGLQDGARGEHARKFCRLVERLAAAGAEAAAVTSLAGHFCIEELQQISPLPILNALPAMHAYFETNNIGSIGLLGSKVVLESKLYGGVTSADIVVPQGGALQATHDAYIAMAVAAAATEEQRAFFFSTGKAMCDHQGAEAVVLAGTDLFLAFDGYDPGFPVIDAAEIHIDALARASMGEAKTGDNS